MRSASAVGNMDFAGISGYLKASGSLSMQNGLARDGFALCICLDTILPPATKRLCRPFVQVLLSCFICFDFALILRKIFMQHIHIIGIGGTFMGSLAALAKEAGFTVSGCDAAVYPPMSTQLAELGIAVHEGFDAEQLQQYQADVFVIGNVAKRGMPVVEAILNRGLPYMSGPQWLAGHILQDRWVLAVAGTHGKTTTASMLAWILDYAGLGAGFLIGGIPQNFGISARLPKMMQEGSLSRFFVIEADEYDTAFFDKRAKFVHYRPRTVILNNLEFDHADIYPNLAAIQTQFHHLLRTVPSEGTVVYRGGDAALKAVLDMGCWSERIAFADADAWSVGAVSDTGEAFDVCRNGQPVGRIEWTLLGEHNRLNALAAIVAAQQAGVPLQVACDALSEFENVKRRMELKGTVQGVAVYDDFAHHPTAIAATIAGLRRKVGRGRILAVLEPRSNTMKLGVMKAALPESLTDADAVFCYAGGVDWDVGEALSPLGKRVAVCGDLADLTAAVARYAQAGDSVLVMSNGGFGGIHERLLAALASGSPAAD